ncbi:MAG TPA: phenylalanine--tRNA ligase subunit alpha [Candidatus Hydrogenedentes bacterium]|nr:phenylalanine--tRNA ligase subunit alpha [Candidatus Hydrogenedentota bacterium]HPC15638.1 phenylalanine--tRNA ligase subunit alpha [Candidatus Hydrogenedentota bacterium]HRT19458.1 phenylalanine--tRNA ligase subunit alpha [Candidatus Hydrogenedentota bacterium]HRT63808.1 phenylalanine--tRNA ligase subunit alpha [Candidatus Hydrogenedentota bacterium]
MKAKLEQIAREALESAANAASLQAIEELRVKYLGRKGLVTEALRGLAQVPAEERPAMGQAANEAKRVIGEAIEKRAAEIAAIEADRKAKSNRVDLSLPGRRPPRGHMHVIPRVTEEILRIFQDMGFQVATGPDIETEYYNFDCLNTPADHPARDSHDTFFVSPGVVLRTHTSPVQMRVMERTQPPVAIVAPGRVYRVDYDASHSPMFFQLEGLLVDRGITFADLKGTLMHFIHSFFSRDTKVRFRPHFFPFTEPSAEVDISCTVCKGAGCRVCKNSGWLEILGCGMVHPEVFRHAKYDYEQYTGYAFGLGVDRIAMLKHAIDSIGLIYENDLRFCEQF